MRARGAHAAEPVAKNRRSPPRPSSLAEAPTCVGLFARHAGYLVSVDSYMNLQVRLPIEPTPTRAHARARRGRHGRRRSAWALRARTPVASRRRRRAAAAVCCAQLASTEEWIDGQFSGNLGEVLIRCNNVLYLRGVPEEDEGS